MPVEVNGVSYELPVDDGVYSKVPLYNEAIIALSDFFGSNSLISEEGVIIGADSDASGTDTIQLQTRSATRLRINNDGSVSALETLKVGQSGRVSASRIEMATETATIVSTWVRTHEWDDGPAGEEVYKQHSYSIASYNENDDSSKVIPGIASWNLCAEMPYYIGGEFITEWHLNWQSPDGSISKRFWGAAIGETSGDPEWFFWGQFAWYTTDGVPSMVYTPSDGRLDLSYNLASHITLPNNVPLFFWDSGHGSTFPVINFNDDEEVEVAPGGQLVRIAGSVSVVANVIASQFMIAGDEDTYIRSFFSGYLNFYSNGSERFRTGPEGVDIVGGPLFFDSDGTFDLGRLSGGGTYKRPVNVYATGAYHVGANQIVGAQGAAVADATDAATVITQLNALLARLRTHGLIAT